MGQLQDRFQECKEHCLHIHHVEYADLAHHSDPDVMLHVCDLGHKKFVQRANKRFKRLGTGWFHVGVEVYGVEYSFGETQEGGGVFEAPAKACKFDYFSESLSMGRTPKDLHQVADILEKQITIWKGPHYHIMSHNCAHFCAHLLDELEVKPMPPWVMNLASAGATLSAGYTQIQEFTRVNTNSIIKAAKEGNINSEYQVQAKFRGAKAQAWSCERSCGTWCTDGGRSPQASVGPSQSSSPSQSSEPTTARIAEGGHGQTSTGRVSFDTGPGKPWEEDRTYSRLTPVGEGVLDPTATAPHATGHDHAWQLNSHTQVLHGDLNPTAMAPYAIGYDHPQQLESHTKGLPADLAPMATAPSATRHDHARQLESHTQVFGG